METSFSFNLQIQAIAKCVLNEIARTQRFNWFFGLQI